jgi:hypothetical protein
VPAERNPAAHCAVCGQRITLRSEGWEHPNGRKLSKAPVTHQARPEDEEGELLGDLP